MLKTTLLILALVMLRPTAEALTFIFVGGQNDSPQQSSADVQVWANSFQKQWDRRIPAKFLPVRGPVNGEPQFNLNKNNPDKESYQQFNSYLNNPENKEPIVIFAHSSGSKIVHDTIHRYPQKKIIYYNLDGFKIDTIADNHKAYCVSARTDRGYARNYSSMRQGSANGTCEFRAVFQVNDRGKDVPWCLHLATLDRSGCQNSGDFNFDWFESVEVKNSLPLVQTSAVTR